MAVTDPLCGTVLDGRYRVEAALARGGMSTVYTGTDLRLDRTVAIKVMSRGLVDDPAFVSRFGQEARAAARLSHPNVVGVFDQGADRGHVFLVMQLVRGRTLRDLLREQGRLSPELAVTVLEAVLTALSAAHRAGLVHRDIKPENILLADDASDGAAVKVADFGLARAVAHAASTTTAGAALGTISYVAPEQVTRGTTDPRTDVYSAGIVLYEMLTGRTPYVGDSAISVAYRHVHDDVPPPSDRLPGLPEELDAITLRATRREPGARPVDAGAFLAELRDLRADLGLRVVPIPARPQTEEPDTPRVGTEPLSAGRDEPRSRRRGEQHRHRRRFLVALALIGLLGLAVATAGWWFGSGRYTSVPKLSRLSVAEARTTARDTHLRVEVMPARVHSENVPVGAVVSTDPGRGHRVLRDAMIELRLSSGPERYVLPARLLGAPEAAARTALKGVPVEASYPNAYDDRVPAGSVVSITPDPGTQLRRNQPVTVVVSRGPEPFAVPSEVGQNADAANTALTGAGLQPRLMQQYDDTVPQGQVISQSPAPGNTVVRGAVVDLVVSQGPALVAVPDVTRQQVGTARAALVAAGFVVDVRAYFGGKFGLVVRESPTAGSKVPRGTTIQLLVF